VAQQIKLLPRFAGDGSAEPRVIADQRSTLADAQNRL